MRIVLRTFTEKNHFTIGTELHPTRKFLPLGFMPIQSFDYSTHHKHAKISLVFNNFRYEFINVQVRRLLVPLCIGDSL